MVIILCKNNKKTLLICLNIIKIIKAPILSFLKSLINYGKIEFGQEEAEAVVVPAPLWAT